MEGQQFCLRWHNFQNTLLSSLPKLLDGGYLTDVTLSAGGRHIHAHRIILSACSYYFKELFKDLNSLQHPVIVLPGMEYTILCALVTFMYNGEVNIYQEQLPALLAMADTLHIRGLADIAGKNLRHDNGLYVPPPGLDVQEKSSLETVVKSEIKENVTGIEAVEPLTAVGLADNMDEELSNDQEGVSYCVKTAPYYSINAKLKRDKNSTLTNITSQPEKLTEKTFMTSVTDESTSISEDQNTLTEETKFPPIWDANLKFLASSATNRSPQTCNKSSVTCLVCGKQLSNQYNLRVHMETHSNSSYSCTACSHVSRSRDALRKHVSYRHPVSSPQKRPRYNVQKP